MKLENKRLVEGSIYIFLFVLLLYMGINKSWYYFEFIHFFLGGFYYLLLLFTLSMGLNSFFTKKDQWKNLISSRLKASFILLASIYILIALVKIDNKDVDTFTDILLLELNSGTYFTSIIRKIYGLVGYIPMFVIIIPVFILSFLIVFGKIIGYMVRSYIKFKNSKPLERYKMAQLEKKRVKLEKNREKKRLKEEERLRNEALRREEEINNHSFIQVKSNRREAEGFEEVYFEEEYVEESVETEKLSVEENLEVFQEVEDRIEEESYRFEKIEKVSEEGSEELNNEINEVVDENKEINNEINEEAEVKEVVHEEKETILAREEEIVEEVEELEEKEEVSQVEIEEKIEIKEEEEIKEEVEINEEFVIEDELEEKRLEEKRLEEDPLYHKVFATETSHNEKEEKKSLFSFFKKDDKKEKIKELRKKRREEEKLRELREKERRKKIKDDIRKRKETNGNLLINEEPIVISDVEKEEVNIEIEEVIVEEVHDEVDSDKEFEKKVDERLERKKEISVDKEKFDALVEVLKLPEETVQKAIELYHGEGIQSARELHSILDVSLTKATQIVIRMNSIKAKELR